MKKYLPYLLHILYRYRVILMGGCLLLFFSYTFLKNYQSHILEVDEIWFINKSIYFDLYFIKHNFTDPRWHTVGEPAQPKIGIYLYGLTLHLYGVKDIESTLDRIDFDPEKGVLPRWWHGWVWQKLDQPTPEVLRRLDLIWKARLTGITFTVLSLSLVYILGVKLIGWYFATLSALFISFNPLQNYMSQLATTDMMQSAAFYLTLLLLWYWHKAYLRNNSHQLFIYHILLGLTAAFAAGVKAIGVLALLYSLLIFCLVYIAQLLRKQNIRSILIGTLLTLVVFFSFLIALHPYLWHETLPHFYQMYIGRYQDANMSWTTSPGTAIMSRNEAIRLIITHTLFPRGSFTNFPFGNFPVDLLLYLTGIVLMIRKGLLVFVKTKIFNGEMLLLLWHFFVVESLILYLKNNWPRYYLPVVVSITLIEAYAISRGIRMLIAKLRLISV